LEKASKTDICVIFAKKYATKLEGAGAKLGGCAPLGPGLKPPLRRTHPILSNVFIIGSLGAMILFIYSFIYLFIFHSLSV